MAEEEREPKIAIRIQPVTDPLVVAHLQNEMSCFRPSVMIAQKSRRGRSHLRLHRKSDGGFYVKVGYKGADKQALAKCEVTYLDGEPTLFQFIFQSTLDAEARQLEIDEARWARQDAERAQRA